MFKNKFIVLAMVLLTACGGSIAPKPTVGIRDGGAQTPKCAELEAQVASSPNVVVPGAWACLSPEMQNEFSALLQITSDQGLATYAATDPSFRHYYSCGLLDGFYYFDLRDSKKDSTMHYSIRMSIDSTSGLVDNLQYAQGYTNANTCP